MTIWVLQCWARDLPNGDLVSQHPTLEAAVFAALSWLEADRLLLPKQGSVYSIAESDEYLRR